MNNGEVVFSSLPVELEKTDLKDHILNMSDGTMYTKTKAVKTCASNFFT